MPCIPEHSLLRVEMPDFHHSHGNIELDELYKLWSTISKSSCAIQNGRRYENMAWRLMNSAAFCRPDAARFDLEPSHPALTQCLTPKAKSSLSVPALSDSDDDDDESSADETPIQTDIKHCSRPGLGRLDSSESSRSRRGETRIALTSLEKMVTTIQETSLEPIEIPSRPLASRVPYISASAPSKQTSKMDLTSLTSSRCEDMSSNTDSASSHATINTSSPSTIATKGSSMVDSTSQLRAGSHESSNTEGSTHSIIRGFVPGGASSSYRSQTRLPAQPTPILKSSSSYMLQPKKKGAMFTLGSSSAEEEESSLESNMGKTSVGLCLKRTNGLVNVKKQTSFKEEVAIGQASRDSPVFEESDDEDEVSESAVDDDDDSSDWEDSEDPSEDGVSAESELFQRVDSHPNLASRRSLLTTALHAPERASAFQAAAMRSTPTLRRSRTSTPNGPSLATSPTTPAPIQMPVDNTSRSKPIAMSHSQFQMATSPRTTRRAMLQSEMTDSLRRNLLWERQQKTSSQIQRRHTSTDIKNLKQHPERGPVFSPNSTMQYNNDVFNINLNDIHTKGW